MEDGRRKTGDRRHEVEDRRRKTGDGRPEMETRDKSGFSDIVSEKFSAFNLVGELPIFKEL